MFRKNNKDDELANENYTLRNTVERQNLAIRESRDTINSLIAAAKERSALYDALDARTRELCERIITRNAPLVTRTLPDFDAMETFALIDEACDALEASTGYHVKMMQMLLDENAKLRGELVRNKI